MVISLGQLTLKTKPKSGQQNVAGMHTSGLTNEDIMREMLEQAYDKFELDIQNIQVSWKSLIMPWNRNRWVWNVIILKAINRIFR